MFRSHIASVHVAAVRRKEEEEAEEAEEEFLPLKVESVSRQVTVGSAVVEPASSLFVQPWPVTV